VIAADWLLLDSAAPSAEEPLTKFLAGTADGELVLPFCGSGHPLDLDQLECEREGCPGGPRQWREVSRTGTVIASIVMHRLEKSFIAATAPYPVLEVELDSGHRLYVSTDRHTRSVVFPAGEIVDIAFVRVGETSIPRIALTEKRSGK
jgi:uncharacterized OB-fold protein